MAPSEVAAIDEWGFQNRIRTRGEAIRRLCQIGLALADRETKLAEIVRDSFLAYYGLYSTMKDHPDAMSAEVADQIEALGKPIDQLFRLSLLLDAENLPMKQNPDMEEALAQVRDLRSRMKDFTRASLPGDPPPEDD